MAAARRRWDATVRRGKLRYRDAAERSTCRCPRLPGRHQAMQRRARRRHAPPPATLAMFRPARWRAASARRDGPARLQLLGPAATAWSAGPRAVGRRRRTTRRPRARSQPTRWPRIDGSRSRSNLRQTGRASDRRRHAGPVAGIAAAHTVPIPDHSHHDPREIAMVAQARVGAANARLPRPGASARGDPDGAATSSSSARSTSPAKPSPPTARCPTRRGLCDGVDRAAVSARSPRRPAAATRIPSSNNEQDCESTGRGGPAEHGRIAISVERSRRRCRGPATRSGRSATTATHIARR